MKKISYIIAIIAIVFLTIGLIIMNQKNNNKLSLDDQMTKYCEQIYKDQDIGDREIYISLKTMKEKYNFNVSEFEKEKHNCSLENSMARVYKENGKLICSVNLICENK